MSNIVDLVIPDLGPDKDVDLIEIMVEVGEEIEVEDGLVTLETDKASMDVPSTEAGTIKEILVNVGDKVNSGDVIAKIEVAGAVAAVAPVLRLSQLYSYVTPTTVAVSAMQLRLKHK